MSVDLLILLVSSLSIALLGLVIFVRNPQIANNRRFALVSSSLVLWTVFNFLSDNSPAHNLLFTRLTFFAGILSVFLVLDLIANFPVKIGSEGRHLSKIHSIFTVLLLPIIFTPYFISSVSDKPSTELDAITTSFLYNLFVVYLVYSAILLAIIVKKQSQKSKSFLQKQQSRIISYGIVLYAVFAISSNVLLPLVSDSWSSSRYGPLFTLFLVGVVAYSIAKHKLFDIQFVIARTIAYVLSLGFVAGSLSLLVFGLSGLIERSGFSFATQNIVYVSVTMILVLSYPALKKFFDQVTNRFFYQDAYDPQNFISEVNRAVVGDIEINSLLKKVMIAMQTNLKLENCTFVIIDENGSKTFIVPEGLEQKTLNDLDFSRFNEDPNKTIIITDLVEDSQQGGAKRQLIKHDIAVVVNLTSRELNNTQNSDQLYMLLGRKKSGNPYSRQDERILRIVSNELMLAMQNALRFEEISQFNITLQKKIEDATRDLQRSNTKLKALDEAKDDFISMASHQLRTPLTSVKGYLSMVLDGDAGPVKKEQKALLEQAFDSSQRMVYLISDLLNVSRLRTGKFIIENGVVNLADLVQGEIEQLQKTAASRHLTMSYDHPKDFPDVMLDETKIRQVIMNFLDNAIYYTPAGGHITVAVKATPRTVEYTVTDTGLGVPATEQKHLFTKFFRAGNAKKMRPDGTGLGLYMAKKVIVAQGGAIIFKSQPGKGSTFGFSFALSKVGIKN